MRSALLVGGPFDGMVTDVADQLPPYWLLPFDADSRTTVRRPDKVGSAPAMRCWQTVTYRLLVMNWGDVHTQVVIYIFVEVSK